MRASTKKKEKKENAKRQMQKNSSESKHILRKLYVKK